MDIVMVILACLNGECRDYTVPLAPEVSLFECNLHGQIGVQEWKQSHPRHEFRRYRCYTSKDYQARVANNI